MDLHSSLLFVLSYLVLFALLGDLFCPCLGCSVPNPSAAGPCIHPESAAGLDGDWLGGGTAMGLAAL